MTDRLAFIAAKLQGLRKRAAVVLTAAPTWIAAGMAVVQYAAAELAAVLPDGAAETVGAVSARIAAVLAGAILIIRRVTPVVASERGLLPREEVTA